VVKLEKSAVPPGKRIYVVRKGNGQGWALPAILAPGDRFAVRNLTSDGASVDFTGVPVSPAREEVPAGSERSFSVNDDAAFGFYEYEIELSTDDRGHQYVEGGSKPNVIIDP